MRPAFIALLTAAGLVATLLATALAADRVKTANLDSDSALERVVARTLCEAPDGTLTAPQPTCTGNRFPRRRLEIEDSCNGQPAQVAISSVQDNVYRLRIRQIDGATRRPE